MNSKIAPKKIRGKRLTRMPSQLLIWGGSLTVYETVASSSGVTPKLCMASRKLSRPVRVVNF
jgi:hypothetical protein